MANNNSTRSSAQSNPAAGRDLPDGEPSDQDLAGQAGAGCVVSFERLVERHTGRLLRFLVQRTRNRHDAEDLVQETWVRAYRFLDKYNPVYGFPTWLFTIAVNLANSRARRRREMTVLDQEAELRHEAATAVSETAATLMQDSESREILWSIVDRVLPDAQRKALWLFYAEDLSVRDIAAVMDMSATNVKVLLHRARTRLGEELRFGAGKSPKATPAYLAKSRSVEQTGS